MNVVLISKVIIHFKRVLGGFLYHKNQQHHAEIPWLTFESEFSIKIKNAILYFPETSKVVSPTDILILFRNQPIITEVNCVTKKQ